MASAARLNARVRRAERQVAALHEDELVRAYRAALGGLARDIADRFTYEATHTPVEALAAAGAPETAEPPPPPRWVPPPGPALYAAVARAGAVKKIRSVQAAILTEMQKRVAIGFDVVGAPSQTLLDNLGARADEALSAAVREPVATAMATSYREGDTIVEAARAIRAAVNDAKVWQAVMLARTDLIGISNGSSLLQARALNVAAPTPIITTKKWLATNDNRTRHTHREADGQEVPIDARFTVGNSQLDYPGDPHGSDSEVINCRCTVLLLDTPTKAALRAAGVFDPVKHPHRPGGDPRGGQWAPTTEVAIIPGDPEYDWITSGHDPARMKALNGLLDEVDKWPRVEPETGGASPRFYGANAVMDAMTDPSLAVITARKDGRLVGVGNYAGPKTTVPELNAGIVKHVPHEPFLYGGTFAAIEGGGLPLFSGFVDEAVKLDAGAIWVSGNPRATKLYKRVGIKQIPKGKSYEGAFQISAEQARILADDLFGLVRKPDAIAASAWDGVLALTYDESQHPRDPGGEGGGRWIPKGTAGVGTRPERVKDVGTVIAKALLMNGRREFLAALPEMAQLPIPPGEYAGPTVYGGGVSVSRLPSGGYVVTLPGDLPYFRAPTLDEVQARVLEAFDDPTHLAMIEKNWNKKLEGGVMTMRNAPEVIRLFDTADARNATSPSFQALVHEWGVEDVPQIVLNEKGLNALGKDLFVSGHYDPGLGVIFYSGDGQKLGIDLDREHPGRNYGPRIGKFEPPPRGGRMSVDGIIRHETAHAAWNRMPQEMRDEFVAMVPNESWPKDMRAEHDSLSKLSAYAAGSRDYYMSDKGGGTTENPWQGEVFAEAVAATTDPQYDPADWPDWVNEMGDWIKTRKRT